MTDEQELAERFESAGLERYAWPILEMAAACVDLVPGDEPDAAIPVGASKAGGDPDLPADFTWPTYEGRDLSFLTQVDLAEVPRDDLADAFPPAGLLSFFYDERSSGLSPGDRGSARVYWFDPMAALSRTARDGVASRPERAWTFQAGTSLPNFDDVEEEFDFTADEYEVYAAVEASIAPLHQMFGNPLAVQDDGMEIECQLVTAGLTCSDASGYEDPRAEGLMQDAGRWRLLLQLDSDESLRMMWGDLGRLYVWIPEESLRAGRFGDAWLIFQGGAGGEDGGEEGVEEPDDRDS